MSSSQQVVQTPVETEKKIEEIPPQKAEDPVPEVPKKKSITLQFDDVDDDEINFLTAQRNPKSRSLAFQATFEHVERQRNQEKELKEAYENHVANVKTNFTEIYKNQKDSKDLALRNAVESCKDQLEKNEIKDPSPFLISSFAHNGVKNSVSQLESTFKAPPMVTKNINGFDEVFGKKLSEKAAVSQSAPSTVQKMTSEQKGLFEPLSTKAYKQESYNSQIPPELASAVGFGSTSVRRIPSNFQF